METRVLARDRRWRQLSPTTPNQIGGRWTTPKAEAATLEATDGKLRVATAEPGVGRERPGVRVPQILQTGHAATDAETEIVHATAMEAGTGAVIVIGGEGAPAGRENLSAEDVVRTIILITTTTERRIGRAW